MNHSDFTEGDHYWVTGRFIEDKSDTSEPYSEHQIGDVNLPVDATADQMPFEIEINGFTYVREDV